MRNKIKTLQSQSSASALVLLCALVGHVARAAGICEGVAFMPFHFGGQLEGKDLRDKYPDGADPYVLGESTNTAQTYGYDSVTQMQETKATLCKIFAA